MNAAGEMHAARRPILGRSVTAQSRDRTATGRETPRFDLRIGCKLNMLLRSEQPARKLLDGVHGDQRRGGGVASNHNGSRGGPCGLRPDSQRRSVAKRQHAKLRSISKLRSLCRLTPAFVPPALFPGSPWCRPAPRDGVSATLPHHEAPATAMRIHNAPRRDHDA